LVIMIILLVSRVTLVRQVNMIAIQKIMADLTKITQKAKGRQRFTKIRIIVIKETRNPVPEDSAN
jgi:hypothetical protein